MPLHVRATHICRLSTIDSLPGAARIEQPSPSRTRCWSSSITCLSCPAPYHDLGGTYFDERERDAVRRRLVGRLQRLGYGVQLQPQST